MEITDKNEELTSFEPAEQEPYHYFAFTRGKTGGWGLQYTFPMTDKQALINILMNNTTYYDQGEARIMKVRLPLGQRNTV